jgi:hypothetical protein
MGDSERGGAAAENGKNSEADEFKPSKNFRFRFTQKELIKLKNG